MNYMREKNCKKKREKGVKEGKIVREKERNCKRKREKKDGDNEREINCSN